MEVGARSPAERASDTGDFCYEVEGEANKAAPPVIGRDSHHARVTEDWAVGPTRQPQARVRIDGSGLRGGENSNGPNGV